MQDSMAQPLELGVVGQGLQPAAWHSSVTPPWHGGMWSASWHDMMLSCLSQRGVTHGFLPGMEGPEGPDSHREELEQELCAPLSCHGRVNHQILHRAVARDDPLIFHYPAGPLSRRSYL